MTSSDFPIDLMTRTDSSANEYSGRARRTRMSTSVKANRLVVLALGEQLRNILHGGSRMIKDRKYHLRTYKTCFIGNEMIDWLIERGEVASRGEGVEVMQKLLEYGVIHHGKSSPDHVACMSCT